MSVETRWSAVNEHIAQGDVLRDEATPSPTVWTPQAVALLERSSIQTSCIRDMSLGR